MSKSDGVMDLLSKSENTGIASLDSYHILNTLPEREYDSITRLVAYICKKPIAKITFIDAGNEFIKSHTGGEADKAPARDSICQFTIQSDQILEISDTKLDSRTAGLSCVKGEPNIRFYAGAPLISLDGLRLGSLCVADVIPGKLDEEQRNALETLAQEVMSHLEARRKNIELNDLLHKYEEINTMFNSSAELHFILDREGNIRHMNSVVEKMVGYTHEEAMGQSIWKFLYKDDVMAVIPILEKGLSMGQKSFELEGRAKLKDGGLKWMGCSVAVKNGKWYVNGRDISEQKKMVSELEQLSLVANKVNNGVIISDSNNHIIWANEASELITGYSFDDLKGHRLGDKLRGEKTDLSALRKAREYTLNKQPFSLDLFVQRKDGSPAWISIINSVILDADGNVDRGVEVIIDITARKKAEEELEILSLVASKSSSGVVIRDGEGKVTWVNSSLENIFGYTLKDLEGRRVGEVVNGEGTDPRTLEIADKAIKEKKPYSIDLMVYKKDGSSIWIHTSTTPILNQQGEIERQVEIINDISERKLAEQELIKTREEALQLSKAKQTFLSVMSHEIRTPLNAVIGMSNILMEDNPTETQVENLKILGFSAQNLLKLINDILDFTKIETGNMVLESVNVNLKELVAQTMNSLRFKTAEKSVVLKSEIDYRIPTYVKGDNTRLYQILINLLGNSVKFTEKGTVKLKADLVEEKKKTISVRFEVSDTGIGIAPDMINYIFESYTQASTDTTRKYGGTGLGLAITRSLLKLYKSEIIVESELGKGSTFSFIIDFTRSDEPVMLVPGKTPLAKLSASVLVVDDNEINRILAGKVISKWGIKVDFAENGKIALEKVQQANYDLILMDLHMPVMDGMQAAKAIRNLGGDFRSLPIIALTASMFAHELETISECGMNGYVMKPFVPVDLYNKIKTFLNVKPEIEEKAGA